MTENLVFLLEEPSAQDFLEGFLPKVLKRNIPHHFLVFEGKQDLEKQMVRRMKGWLRPNSLFFVIRDQDSGDCIRIKSGLLAKCEAAGRPDSVVRIACRELESFFVGDWEAIAQAFSRPNLRNHDRSAKYRNPDLIGSPSREIKRLIPDYQKRDGARRISLHLTPDRNKSRSFQALVKSLQRL